MALRVVENALGVTQSIGPEAFYYINLAIDISDLCDCIGVGAPLVMHDIGILGSSDLVAIDHATLNAMKDMELNPDANVDQSQFEGLISRSEIIFDHGRKMGLGTTDYEIVTLSKDPPKTGGPH
jgi:uncharacterized Fe-S center protein